MMKKTFCLFVLVVLASSQPVLASLDLAVNDVGISFGNSTRFSGLRLNFVDKNVRVINGINLTFWKPDDNDRAVYNGLQVGLIGLAGREMNGIHLAGIGIGTESLTGLGIGLIGMGVEEEFKGIGLALIGMGGGDFRGVFVGGIGLGAETLHGVGAGLIGVGASEFRGIGFGGIGLGGDDIKGIVVGGVGVGGDNITGIGLGGIGVGGDKLSGLFAGIIGVGGDDLRGIFMGLAGVGGNELHGAALGGLISRFKYAKGVTPGAWNRAISDMIGFQIGVANTAEYLEGVQIGLINYVGNNPKWARLLPIINMHFSRD
jgi:hypothetical protein